MPLVKLTQASAAKFMPAASKAATTIEMAVLEPSGCCHRPRLTHAATKLAGTAAPLGAPEDPPYPSMPLTFKLKRFCAFFFQASVRFFSVCFWCFFGLFRRFSEIIPEKNHKQNRKKTETFSRKMRNLKFEGLDKTGASHFTRPRSSIPQVLT